MRIIEDLDTFANLLNSIKPSIRRKERPFSPYECSDLIERMTIELNSEREVMERLDIKKDMFKNFRALQKYPNEYKHAIVWGSTNDNGISFSSATLIAQMKSNDHEKKKLSEATMKYNFSKNEIRNITSLKNKYENLDIEQCIEKVKKIRPVIEIHHVIILPISLDILKSLEEISVKRDISTNSLLTQLLTKIVKIENIFSIFVKKNYLIFSLNEDGYMELVNGSREKGMSIKKILSQMIQPE